MVNPVKLKNFLEQLKSQPRTLKAEGNGVGRQYLDSVATDFNDMNKYNGNPDSETGIVGRDQIQNPSTGNLRPETLLIRDKARFYDYYGDDMDSMSYDEALEQLREQGLLGKPYNWNDNQL